MESERRETWFMLRRFSWSFSGTVHADYPHLDQQIQFFFPRWPHASRQFFSKFQKLMQLEKQLINIMFANLFFSTWIFGAFYVCAPHGQPIRFIRGNSAHFILLNPPQRASNLGSTWPLALPYSLLAAAGKTPTSMFLYLCSMSSRWTCE